MDNGSFWLFNFDNSVLSVSLILFQNGIYQVGAIGPTVAYQPDNDSLVAAADESLSETASQANITDNQEPDNIALILPPFWVDSDGKIVSDKHKLIESICRGLKLKPMGFIANDDAIVEDANYTDGFPASFILVNIGLNNLTVSLTYLGKIIERISKPITDPLDPVSIENCLLEFKTESTLPPQIIIFGAFNDSVIESIKNYTWIGKKNIETFLHFPEIKTYSVSDVTTIYTRAITLQFNPQSQETAAPEVVLPVDQNEVIENTDPIDQNSTDNLIEVSAADLGFNNLSELPSSPEPLPVVAPSDYEVETIPSKPKLTFPKIKLPHIKLPRINNLLLTILVLSPLLVLIPFFLSRANITLYLTPYNFNKQMAVTLDPNLIEINPAQKMIPVDSKTFTVNSSASVSTTGDKTIGDKARGEIIVYNKQDKVQNLTKGAILIDDKGNKFELVVAASIASSSSNLEAGVINMGQTRVMITAVDIGPEYNLAKDTKLYFKDYAETILIAKVVDQLSGGSKRQAKAVSAIDKINVDKKINNSISQEIDKRINQEIGKISGIIKEAQQIKKGRTEYSRELGEEADELTANSINTVTIYYLDTDKKLKLLDFFLSTEEGYTNSTIIPDNFDISISSVKTTTGTIQGLLAIQGRSISKIDINSLKRLLSGKSLIKAQTLIRNTIPRVYNFQIDRNLSFLNFINPLPYRLQNITVEVK